MDDASYFCRRKRVFFVVTLEREVTGYSREEKRYTDSVGARVSFNFMSRLAIELGLKK